MSVFKTKGILLKIQKYGQDGFLYTIFFREYGILRVTKKKKSREKPLDIGYVIDCEIFTRSDRDIHTIGSIKILHQFYRDTLSFRDIHMGMSILSRVRAELPVGNPHIEVFDTLSSYIAQDNPTEQFGLLTALKLESLLGNLPETHSDTTTQKVLKFIHSSSYRDILRLQKIPAEQYQFLLAIIPA